MMWPSFWRPSLTSPPYKRPSTLWAGTWDMYQPPKIKSTHRRKLGCTRDRSRNRVLHVCYYIRNNILGYHRTNNERYLGTNHQADTSASEKGIRPGPLPRTLDSKFPPLPPLQTLVYSTNSTGFAYVYSATNYSSDMVYMEGCGFQSTHIDPTDP